MLNSYNFHSKWEDLVVKIRSPFLTYKALKSTSCHCLQNLQLNPHSELFYRVLNIYFFSYELI
jgi:hypothetical protein